MEIQDFKAYPTYLVLASHKIFPVWATHPRAANTETGRKADNKTVVQGMLCKEHCRESLVVYRTDSRMDFKAQVNAQARKAASDQAKM